MIDVLSGNLTFDLHCSNNNKAQVFKTWVQRIYSVAKTLDFSYLELWELTEQEFLILEELALQVQAEDKKRKEELLNREGNYNG